MTIRIVNKKINKIKYNYDIIYEKIEKIMQDDNIIDLGEKKISIFGLFDISIDFIPDIIERKTVVSVIVGILEELKFLEISNKNMRLKLEMTPIESNLIKPNLKKKGDNKMLLDFVKNFYNEKIEKNLEGIDIDDKMFSYVVLIVISIMEDSSIVILGHQISFECIALENNLQESTSENILIDRLLKFFK